MMNHQPESIQAAGGGYGPPPGGMPPGGGMGGGYGAPPPGGAPMAPPGGGMMPGGMPGGMTPGGGGGNADLAAKANKYFILSLCSLCGCGLLAIIPILFSHQAKEAVAKGDMATAEQKLGTVKICLILWVVLLVFNVLAIIANVIIGIAAS